MPSPFPGFESEEKLLCAEHGNDANFICLVKECPTRLMCMLCEHNHELFSSLQNRTHIDLKTFTTKVNTSIDRSLKYLDELENGGVKTQKEKIEKYYSQIKTDLITFIDRKLAENLNIFDKQKNVDFNSLVRARIETNYHKLPQESFEKVVEVFEGKDFQTLAYEQQQRNLEDAYSYMNQFHSECLEMFNRFKVGFRAKVPEIRLKENDSLSKSLYKDKSSRGDSSRFEDYEEYAEQKIKPEIIKEPKLVIESVVSDAVQTPKTVMTIGYDKTLRVFNKNLELLCEKEYNNILTNIDNIGEGVFALGVSKELKIMSVSGSAVDSNKEESVLEENPECFVREIMTLKGHTQRITDISHFNTRILGSCSDEGTKIWDLYKEKCEHTFKSKINPVCLGFMPGVNSLAIGNYDHTLQVNSLENLQTNRCYPLPGTPLCISQENQNSNFVYVSGFSSFLQLIDIRIAKFAFNYDFKSEAINTFVESLHDEKTMLVGERGGKVRVFDLRKCVTRIEWTASKKVGNSIRPNGIVKVFEQNPKEVVTVGAYENKILLWELQDEENSM